MIEFNKVSTESNFIKNLLHSTFLPRLRTVRDDDYIIKDRIYVYKCNIIKCTNSGYIAVKNANLDPNLYPKATLRKTDDEKVKKDQVYYTYVDGSIRKIQSTSNDLRSPMAEGWYELNVASYVILEEYFFGERNDKLCTNFLSSSEGYDYKTHERLGQYLRGLRDMYGLNLMPLYNCFDNVLLENIHITNHEIVRTSEDFQTKVYKVPIRFNVDYTICMENIGMTTFAPAFIRHGTLAKLNNTRFGNGLDITNKYIKLNHEDVIYNKPNLRFKNPITLRFDNIPQNKKVRYSQFVYTEIPAKYMSEYYRKSDGTYPIYFKKYITEPETYRFFKYTTDGSDTVIPDGIPVKQPGYAYILQEDGGSGKEALYPSDTELYPGDNVVLPPLLDDAYESVNPSIGTFNSVAGSFKKCSEDETVFNKKIFDSDKDKYYVYDTTENKFVQCTEDWTYSESDVYYYKSLDTDLGWYEFIDGEFVKTEDTFIKNTFYKCADTFSEDEFNKDKTKYYIYDSIEDTYTQCTSEDEFYSDSLYFYKDTKKYYKKDMTEIITSYNYDITEENCCMYDYVEDELYLLIQVPQSFNSSIVILEGDYTNFANERIYDNVKFELFNDRKLDYLFTKNLKLMESGGDTIIPFSDTLIQFLLWHVICSLDTINGDMNRVVYQLGSSGSLPVYPINNYWYSRYRELVFNYADTYPKKYISDNLGYITTDIENIIESGATYFNEQTTVDNENIPEPPNAYLEEEGIK